MTLTTEEHKEVVGILQQKEVDLRTQSSEFATQLTLEDCPDLAKKFSAEVDVEADRVRVLWTKMEES